MLTFFSKNIHKLLFIIKQIFMILLLYFNHFNLNSNKKILFSANFVNLNALSIIKHKEPLIEK